MCMQSHTVPKKQARYADFTENPPVLGAKEALPFPAADMPETGKCGG